jgi:hypothetical protein
MYILFNEELIILLQKSENYPNKNRYQANNGMETE